MSIRAYRDIHRRKSRQIMVGNVPVGGDAPITVQTMTNTLTTDVAATVAQIKRAEWDLGSGPWEGGGPTRSASIEWVADENGMISVLLGGTLYAREADDTCGRLEIRYKDADGDILETRQGTEHCMEDDALTEFAVSNGQNFAHYALRQVTYAILKDGVQLGATTVELGDPVILDGPVVNLP